MIIHDSVREAARRAHAASLEEQGSGVLPPSGHSGFLREAIALVYGEDAACIKEGRVAAVQTVGCTGEPAQLQRASHCAL